MRAQELLHPDTAEPHEAPRPLDGNHRPYQVGEALPIRMTPRDMQRAFRYGHTRFCQLMNAGHFDRFEILPRIGNRAWSGDLVARYLAGQSRPASGGVFGRKRAR